MKICSKCGTRFDSLNWACLSCSYRPKRIDGFLSFSPEFAQINDNYEPNFFPQLATLEAENFWFCSRNHLLLWALGRYFPQAQNFLEIGCGTGFVLAGIEKAFPKLTLSGSEIFSTGLAFAAQRLSKADLFQMDACKIPFEEEFDIIGAFDVLEHIKEDRIVLAEMYRATKPGGGIILTVPQHPWLWSQADDYAHHVRRYRAQELKTKVQRAGFKIVRMTSFVSLLLPLMLLSRSQQQRPQLNYDPLSELRISGLANSILGKVLDFERAAIRLGLSFPLGGSLLLIAKK
ncbi:class I SAM-dependent methyltransferase [Coleofasciculus sp. FACHB-129]|uniref:class I SAM-dependent methyltransferase n=1 Tax=Cyanophyceae TaxID=3028117 RepID=UPI001688E969|nr:class I SAM-dependent methyltransferase [Coleofasciculus sp. FACHB-129]MBD1896732.1 class I SAM-dependent methyltransferase [Coleofasciculus sp. FACHB-129]MBD1898778.1 class I SAM-dependent methyltransferase [Coleofasciculus sp. FACHB-125]